MLKKIKILITIKLVIIYYIKHQKKINLKLNDFSHRALHFWRYAMIEKNNNFGSFLDENLKIIICGDWCLNGNVESAFLSAENTTKKLSDYL